MSIFGATSRGAEIIEEERRGGKMRLQVAARGMSERAAKRSAVLEASSIIPVRHQDVINITKTRSYNRISKRYLVTILENSEKEMDVVGGTGGY